MNCDKKDTTLKKCDEIIFLQNKFTKLKIDFNIENKIFRSNHDTKTNDLHECSKPLQKFFLNSKIKILENQNSTKEIFSGYF